MQRFRSKDLQKGKEMKFQEHMNHHPDLFKESLGNLTVATSKVYLEEYAQPHFQNFHQVPYANQ